MAGPPPLAESARLAAARSLESSRPLLLASNCSSTMLRNLLGFDSTRSELTWSEVELTEAALLPLFCPGGQASADPANNAIAAADIHRCKNRGVIAWLRGPRLSVLCASREAPPTPFRPAGGESQRGI